MRKIIVALVAGIALMFSSGCGFVQPDHTAVCHVTGKDRTQKHDGSSDARVYTSNCGTFQVHDSLTRHKFNSADTYGKIHAGHDYKVVYHGWRNGFFSMFPNITEAKEVS